MTRHEAIRYCTQFVLSSATCYAAVHVPHSPSPPSPSRLCAFRLQRVNYNEFCLFVERATRNARNRPLNLRHAKASAADDFFSGPLTPRSTKDAHDVAVDILKHQDVVPRGPVEALFQDLDTSNNGTISAFATHTHTHVLAGSVQRPHLACLPVSVGFCRLLSGEENILRILLALNIEPTQHEINVINARIVAGQFRTQLSLSNVQSVVAELLEGRG